MAFGITDTGFNRKRLDDILVDKNDAIRAVFGVDVNLTPQSPDGQLSGILADSDAALWELIEDAYNAFNPDGVTGVQQDNLVELNGINRLPATSTTAALDLVGLANLVIPAGVIVATATGVQFAIPNQVQLDGAGIATGVPSNAVIAGNVAALAGTITTIVTAISGWTSVTNPADAIPGTNEETDSDLRVRRQASVAFPSQSILDGIFAAISNVAGVESVTVLENDTNVVDSNGQDPHSVQAVVKGGADQDIADALFFKKAAGISTVGTTTIAVVDTQGISHDINFQRPVEIDIFVIVNVTQTTGYPVTGDADITQAIIDYANGDLIAGRGFGVNQDVIHSEIYTPVNRTPGMTVDSIFIDTSASPSATADIPIAFNEISNFITANITVNS